MCDGGGKAAFNIRAPCIHIAIIDKGGQRDQFILFSVVFIPSPPIHHGSILALPVISLLLASKCIAGADLPNHMMGEVSWDP
jgi:hypothetical protein